jgi:hypothetical protein
MEPQLSVLLYSKYSSSSKRLMNIMNTSNVDFTNKFALQTLCIDNEQIRNRVIKNKQIEITTVPCILLTFPDGGVEKYDGIYVFEWVEGIIRQFTKPVQNVPKISEEEEKWRIQRAIEQKTVQEQKILQEYEKSKNIEKNEQENESKPQQQSSKRKPVNKTLPSNSGVTSIDDLDDLPSDEEEDGTSDRYKSRKPVGRIRSDEGNYEEGKDLFKGSAPNNRKAKQSAVKGNEKNDAKSQKSIDIMSKAKELAKGREESAGPPPPGYPLNQKD